MIYVTCPGCSSADVVVDDGYDCEQRSPGYWHCNHYEYIECLTCGKFSTVPLIEESDDHNLRPGDKD